MGIKCFLIEPNGSEYRWLRRFTYSVCKCPLSDFGHDARSPLADGPVNQSLSVNDHLKTDFPEKCACGYVFMPDDQRQVFTEHQYISKERPGELFTLRHAPVGAIWEATWYEDVKSMCGIDGKAYLCETPGGTWHIDGRASNCTRPDDHTHKCWCRHGVAPDFTVDKIGDTCSAGAGSILKGSYHGFLRNGYLT